MDKHETQDNSVNLSLARALQIKEALQQLDAETQNTWTSLTATDGATQTDILALENKYQAKKTELYNELILIQNNLQNAPTEINKEEIIALSKEINLGEILKKRQAANQSGGDNRFLGLCSIDCTHCIYDCATCVSTCGLNGGSLGCTFNTQIAGHRSSSRD